MMVSPARYELCWIWYAIQYVPCGSQRNAFEMFRIFRIRNLQLLTIYHRNYTFFSRCVHVYLCVRLLSILHLGRLSFYVLCFSCDANDDDNLTFSNAIRTTSSECTRMEYIECSNATCMHKFSISIERLDTHRLDWSLPLCTLTIRLSTFCTEHKRPKVTETKSHFVRSWRRILFQMAHRTLSTLSFTTNAGWLDRM